MLDQRDFRQVMGHFATGVTVVASRRSDGTPCGLTANAVASVSLDPLLVLVCLDRSAASHDCVVKQGSFAVSVLEADDRDVALRFARGDRRERFDGLELRETVTGSPVLESALAWVDCRVRDVHGAGDHSIVVGEVVGGDARAGDPLLYFQGVFRRLAP